MARARAMQLASRWPKLELLQRRSLSVAGPHAPATALVFGLGRRIRTHREAVPAHEVADRQQLQRYEVGHRARASRLLGIAEADRRHRHRAVVSVRAAGLTLGRFSCRSRAKLLCSWNDH